MLTNIIKKKHKIQTIYELCNFMQNVTNLNEKQIACKPYDMSQIYQKFSTKSIFNTKLCICSQNI